jgi:hypothetical protein
MTRRRPSLRTLISLLPGLVLAHVLEESGTLLPWRDRHRPLVSKLPVPFRTAMHRMRLPHVVPLYGGLAGFIAGASLLARDAPRGSSRMLGLGVAGWTTVLGTAGHLALSAAARRYTPGVATSLGLLPFAGYLVARLGRDRALSPRQMGLALLLALPLDPPVHLSGALLGRALARRFWRN